MNVSVWSLCCLVFSTVPQTQHLTRGVRRRPRPPLQAQTVSKCGTLSSRWCERLSCSSFLAQSGVNGRVSRKERRRCLQAHVLISETVPIKQITGGNTWHDGRQKRIEYWGRSRARRQTWSSAVCCVGSERDEGWNRMFLFCWVQQAENRLIQTSLWLLLLGLLLSRPPGFQLRVK